MIKYIYKIIASVLLLNICLLGQEVSKVGTTSASFLGIDVGPRATAMGSAFVSVANDATSMYYNPAGISKVKEFDAMFSNTKWIADLSYNYAGVVYNLGDVGNIGVSATFLNMGAIERTTINQPDGTGEMFDAANFAFGLTYAKSLTEQFSIGLTAKYINERLYNSSASGIAFDVGVLYDTKLAGLQLGFSIANYGPKMQLAGQDLLVQHDIDPRIGGNNENINANLQTDKYDLPLMMRIGLSMDLLDGIGSSNLIVSVDALHPSDDVESVNLGAEYRLFNIFSLRAGYKALFADDSEESFTFGAGIKYKLFGGVAFYFDYSYVSFGLFSSVNMFSVGLGI